MVPTTKVILSSRYLLRKNIIWIHHPTPVWLTQVTTSAITLTLTVTAFTFQLRGNSTQLPKFDIILEVLISVPVLITLWPNPDLRSLFIPIFLNCWIARSALKDLFSHRSMGTQSNFSRQLVDVMATIFCLVFTSVCSFEHLQRGSSTYQYDLFQSLYFILVTLSTVGYGDYFPDIWPSQLCMITMMCIALLVLPKQFESLAFTWMEMERLGGSYTTSCGSRNKHVVVCSTALTDDLAMDFLSEFFSHKHLQNFYVVFLASADLDSDVRQIIRLPKWAHRNKFIKGSCLRDEDLYRSRVNEAAACFILGADNSVDKAAADQHTILRSWAVKDFAPSVPQYVQLFRPQSIMHIKFAEHTVCEDEFKYAMLAYNCMIPGTSTLITLLLHTSKGQEGQDCKEPWLQLYGKGSGNEVYHINVSESKIFSRFTAKSFSYAALQAHRLFGVALIGIQNGCREDQKLAIMLNPGPHYSLKSSDICFYLSVTREEDMHFVQEKQSPVQQHGNEKTAPQGSNLRKGHSRVSPSITAPLGCWNQEITMNIGKRHTDERIRKEILEKSIDLTDDIVIGCPPVTPYVGTSPSACHLLRVKSPLCCLQLNQECMHCANISANDYQWVNRAIILVADYASLGIYNFVVPLRAYFHNRNSLKPIILLLEKKPQQAFLDCIAWFPYIYWMLGSIDNLDDLLQAGIHLADNVVVLNREASNAIKEDEDLSDCNTIVGVQTVHKYFPNIKITTELSQSSNMRFMHFQANNAFALYMSEIEKHEKEKGSNISFMFRLQFASGIVFSASMVDTLLYQAFVKDYLIPIVRLLLGIDQAPGSGYLASFFVDRTESWMSTYGSLFKHLSSSNGGVPIALFRTQYGVNGNTSEYNGNGITKEVTSERNQINNLVKSRLENLKLPSLTIDYFNHQTNKTSYVIINPNCDLQLQESDILFILHPPDK